MANIKPLPSFVLTRAMQLAPTGATVESVQAKLVSDIKAALGRANLSLTKTGELSVSKFNKNLETNIAETQRHTGKLTLDSRYGAVGLYRFCLSVIPAMKEWTVLSIELPEEFNAWIIQCLTTVKVTTTPSEEPKTETQSA